MLWRRVRLALMLRLALTLQLRQRGVAQQALQRLSQGKIKGRSLRVRAL